MSKPSIQLFPYLFRSNLGQPVVAEWGQLCVPENRRKNDSRLISIPFVRFLATVDEPGTPIIFLQGGPGGSPLSNLSSLLFQQPMLRPMATADLIFIEHRGCGFAQPQLQCPGTYHIPLDAPADPTVYREAHGRYLTNAILFWQAQGVDLAGYNVREMAADIDALRQALGYEKISLLGASFGSHHGLAVLRYYGQYVERAFLWDVEGPNHTMKLPSNVQKQLETLNDYVKQDAVLQKRVPDLLDLMASVLDRLAREPVSVTKQHPFTQEDVVVVVGKYDLQLVTANGLGNVPFLRALPARYLAMAQGDFSWLAAQAMRERMGLRSNLMEEATDIASGATAVRRQQIAAEAPTTLLGDAMNEPFHALGDLFGNPDLGDAFRGRLYSDVPILLAGGSLDARTPISNAEELLPDLPNGQLLKVAGVSHDMGSRGNHLAEFALCRDQFLRGEPVTVRQLDAGFVFDAL